MLFQYSLLLFWKIGKIVFNKQKTCENSVSKYSKFFSYHFGMSETFSIENVKYMKRFYICFPIYYNKLNTLSFEHYKLLVDVNDNAARYFYFRVAMFCRSSVDELNYYISNNMYSFI